MPHSAAAIPPAVAEPTTIAARPGMLGTVAWSERVLRGLGMRRRAVATIAAADAAAAEEAGAPAVAEAVEDGFAIVALTGQLDAAGAAEAERRLLALDGCRGLVADLSGVRHADGAGLRALLRAAKRAEAAGRHFAVCGLRRVVREAFETSGFDGVIATYRTRSDALAVAG